MKCKKCNYDGQGFFIEDELGLLCEKCHPAFINFQAPVSEIISKMPDSLFTNTRNTKYFENTRA